MLRMVKRLIALSLGVQREQLLQRMGLTWPRPFLLRPLQSVSIHSQSGFVVSRDVVGSLRRVAGALTKDNRER